jgi:glycosyltransferase involved in cell wall biosynthesis
MTCDPSQAHVLCVGGEDHHLRIPFLLELQRTGLRIAAAGTGDPAPFKRAGLDYRPFRFDRFLNPIQDYESVRQLEMILKDVNSDVVQSFDTKPNVLVPLASRGLPTMRVVRTINGMGWVYSSRSPLALALRPVQRALHRSASRMTDLTVFQNVRDKAFFEQNGLVTPERSILIPGSGVDVAGFDDALADGPAPERLRAELGLGNAPVVITVTRLTRQKGIPTLLKAAQRVHRARPEVRFVLVGPRESEGRLAVSQRELDRHAGYVVTTGPRDDVPGLLRMADVFAFPTEYREGVPRALMEAALAGLPIVTTNMPGCEDIVQHGRSGHLVPTRSPRVLAKAILDLLADRIAAKAMGQIASAHVRQNFGLQLTAARYRNVYRTVLDPDSVASSNVTKSVPGAPEAGATLTRDLAFFDRV